MYLFSPYNPVSSDAVDCGPLGPLQRAEGTPYCPDCEPSWATCQFCGAIHCTRCRDYTMSVCQGDDCKRSNCSFGCFCTGINRASLECVRSCEVNEGEEHLSHTFCLACRVKECEKDWDRSCPCCTKIVAPHLAKENYRLVRENELLLKNR